MPVLEQIEKAADTVFDFAETTNERAHEATKNLVAKMQEADVPFADRIPKVELPLVDKLPEPAEAVDAYFGFLSSGIETNRNFAEKVINRFADGSEAPAKPAASKSTAKKSTAKKS